MPSRQIRAPKVRQLGSTDHTSIVPQLLIVGVFFWIRTCLRGSPALLRPFIPSTVWIHPLAPATASHTERSGVSMHFPAIGSKWGNERAYVTRLETVVPRYMVEGGVASRLSEATPRS